MEDFCKYADVFFGNGAVTEFPEEGAASKWFYIKAQCGNTTPHAVLPFGMISAGAYSSGYPTGYGTHLPNFCGGVEKMWDSMKITGFSHLHQSGTGAIDYYYNYAVVTPFYGGLSQIGEPKNVIKETAQPGKYSCVLDKITADLTVTERVAFHRYAFENSEGRVAVDFLNDGLCRSFGEKYFSRVKAVTVTLDSDDAVFVSGYFSGIELFFYVKAQGEGIRARLFTDKTETDEKEIHPSERKNRAGVVFDFEGKHIELKVSFSTISKEKAKSQVLSLADSFDETAEKGYRIWNEYLSAVRIETEDEKLKEKFYSCLYHSLIKPSVMTGENILGVQGDTVADFATFWDQYKTLLPLLYMLYPETGKKIADAIINISETMGKIPCSFGLTDKFPCEKQAKMLGIITLCDAYHFGHTDEDKVSECIKRELSSGDYRDFLQSGYFERYTHILDVCDALRDVADITGDGELKKRLLKTAEFNKNAYGDDGLMSEASPYYEGDRYTYSFRLQNDMEERVQIAGGKKKFGEMLDSFFGFGGESIRQVTAKRDAGKLISKTAYHRFEGFNNECDMETPFAYIFADRHDRLCEIVTAAVNDSFRTGSGAIPGNNDSGGLSSCFVWLVLGIFPQAGTGKMLIGCPQIDRATLRLPGGKYLEIDTVRHNRDSTAVKQVYFNGRRITDFTVEIKELLNGGRLEFVF